MVEIGRVLAVAGVPVAAIPPGPRRWAPSDVAAEVEGDRVTAVRVTFRSLGDRVVVVAGAADDIEVDWLAERLATPLLFAHFRTVRPGVPAAGIMAALQGEPIWEQEHDGWRVGRAGVGTRPVRLAHRPVAGGHLVVAAHGVAQEEVTTLLGQVAVVSPGTEEAADLHTRHRRALAQRWWDAPRTPWRPDERADRT